MKKEECKIRLLKLLEHKFGISKTTLSEARLDLPLLDEDWGISPIDLVYLILEIEKNFEITIPTAYLKNNYRFTINELSELIALLTKLH